MTRVASCQGESPFSWRPIDIKHLDPLTEEPMGTKEKEWVHEVDDRDNRWLYKQARARDGQVRGEDWAECLVHVVAELLGVPSACVALAVNRGKRGVLIKSVVAPDEDLTHGNELMAQRFPSYDMHTDRENDQYTVANIRQALDGVSAPGPYGCWTAFDVFAAYLLLDALVAGRDRHHENWAIITKQGAEARLSPSFDHGNALGFAETPSSTQKLLSSSAALQTWLNRGRSHHFAGKPRLTDVAAEAMALSSECSRSYFMQRLRDLCLGELSEAAERMPTEILSEEQRSLSLLIVEQNRRRLQDAISASQS